jgi:hypothetical protein
MATDFSVRAILNNCIAELLADGFESVESVGALFTAQGAIMINDKATLVEARAMIDARIQRLFSSGLDA